MTSNALPDVVVTVVLAQTHAPKTLIALAVRDAMSEGSVLNRAVVSPTRAVAWVGSVKMSAALTIASLLAALLS